MKHALALVTVLVALGCSSEGDAPGSSAGTGGASGAGGSAGAGGNGSPGAGGVSGTGGAAPVPDVFDSTISVPAHDCRLDRTVKQCVSVSGQIDGTPLDLHCTSTSLPVALWANPDRWPISCRDTTSVPGIEHRYQVDVPLQPPGSFSHSVTLAENPLRVNFILLRDGDGGDADADHFTSGTMAGRVDLDPVTSHDLIAGTFTAKWTTPGQACDGGLADVCKPMQLNGTFYLENHLRPEDFP